MENRREYYPEEVLVVDQEEDKYKLDFKDVQGQDALIEYVVVAAAGGHNILILTRKKKL